jgi:putative ATP-dependent endonuclease of OLD family
MSVGLSFNRYIEIGEKLDKRIAVVTDNDGRSEILKLRYEKYFDKPNLLIQVFFDTDDDYNTLEPQLVKSNGLEKVNKIIDQKFKITSGKNVAGDYKYKTQQELLSHMAENKTECALRFFDTAENFVVPEYIKKAIGHAERK